MKYKLAGIFMAAVMIATAVAATYVEGIGENRIIRYHQHLEEPGYTPCTDHGEEVFCSHLPLIFIETGGEGYSRHPGSGDAGRSRKNVYYHGNGRYDAVGYLYRCGSAGGQSPCG